MELFHSDCLEVLKTLPENSIDSLITDPPAGISFMGKEWDSNKGGRDEWISWLTQVLQECHRVLKPGAHVLVWALPRTSHWTATAIEDAGFEIRDIVMHLFGVGFPKSANISKNIDAKFGFKGGDKIQKVRDIRNGHGRNYGSYCLSSANREGNEYIEVEVHEPQTEEAKEWRGWGTNLKPAAEHWILVRKPISENSITDNVLKWGTGAININECRIPLSGDRPLRYNILGGHSGKTNVYGEFDSRSGMAVGETSLGRFPANVIHDGSEEVLEHFPNTKSGTDKGERGKGGIWQPSQGIPCGPQYGDEGSAARFFYCSKANKQDRDEGLKEFEEKKWVQWQTANGTSGKPSSISEGRKTAYRNTHPTVKNSNLMRYLCRLITPKNGVILDPFMGSGSTGKAAILEGFDFIGIEKEEEYFKIAEARIDFTLNKKKTERGLENLLND